MSSGMKICNLEDILPFGGVAALIDGEQVAIFRLGDDQVFALSNYDPFSNAAVLSRGIIGSINDVPVIASPIYKQHFELATGKCIEDDSVTLKTWPVAVEGGNVVLTAAAKAAA